MSTRQDLLDAGWTARQVDHAVSAGRLTRLRPSVYRDGATWQDAGPNQRHLDHAIALGLALREVDGAVSHASAAVMHGLPLPWKRTPVWGTVHPGRSTRYGTGYAVMAATMLDEDLLPHDRVALTSAARTVADCLRHLDIVDGVAIADAALHRDPALAGEIRRVLERCRRWPGRRRAEQAWSIVDGRRESPAESWSWVAAHRQLLPLPIPQAEVFDGDRLVARVDAWWPEHGVVGEVDGIDKYFIDDATTAVSESPQARARRRLRAEKARENRLTQLGLTVTRWDITDLRRERRWAADLRSVLATGRPGFVRASIVVPQPLH